MRSDNFQIGALSRATGVNIETIRYYEKIGLIPAPPRSQGRQRVYDVSHLKRLTFIRRSRELGFTLDQVRELLGLAHGHDLTCAEVKMLTDGHVADIRQKVKDLRRIDRVLTELSAQCGGDAVPACPILDALSKRNGRPVAAKGGRSKPGELNRIDASTGNCRQSR